jgi:hypothetical protein
LRVSSPIHSSTPSLTHSTTHHLHSQSNHSQSTTHDHPRSPSPFTHTRFRLPMTLPCTPIVPQLHLYCISICVAQTSLSLALSMPLIQVDLCAMLIDRSDSLNSFDQDGNTALHLLAKAPDAAIDQTDRCHLVRRIALTDGSYWWPLLVSFTGVLYWCPVLVSFTGVLCTGS